MDSVHRGRVLKEKGDRKNKKAAKRPRDTKAIAMKTAATDDVAPFNNGSEDVKEKSCT